MSTRLRFDVGIDLHVTHATVSRSTGARSVVTGVFPAKVHTRVNWREMEFLLKMDFSR